MAVALMLTGLLAWRAGIGDVAAVSGTLAPAWLVIALLLTPPSLFIRAFNHSLLLNRDERVIGLADMSRLTLVGVGMSLFLPMGAADLAKAHYGCRIHGHPERMILSSILDKLTSLTALAVMGAIGAVVAGEPWMVAVAVAVAMGSIVPFVAPGLMPWRLLVRVLAPRADIAEERLARAARVPIPLLSLVLTVSLLGWIFSYTITYLCCLAAGVDIGPAYVFALAPLATLAKLMPVSAGGIGLGEVTIAVLLSRTGVPHESAALAALLQMGMVTLLPGIAGLMLFAMGRHSEAATE